MGLGKLKHLIRRILIQVILFVICLIIINNFSNSLLNLSLIFSAIPLVFFIISDIASFIDRRLDEDYLVSLRYEWIYELEKEIHSSSKIEMAISYRELILKKCDNKLENIIVLKNFIQASYLSDKTKKNWMLILTPFFTTVLAVATSIDVQFFNDLSFKEILFNRFFVINSVSLLGISLFMFYLFSRINERRTKSIEFLRLILEGIIIEKERCNCGETQYVTEVNPLIE